MRSNIKGKPGSQGTLFQVKDKGLLNPQQRWPQGYTPERLNAVRQELRHTPISAPDHMYDQPNEDNQREHGVTSFGYPERVRREIAKTNIPTEHLRGLKGIHGEPDEGTHGTYWKGGANDRTIGVDMTQADTDKPRFPGFKRTYNDIAQTLTHEIGHHVNMTLAPTPHVTKMVAQIHAMSDAEGRGVPHTETDTAMQYSRVRPGVDEAQADDYLVQYHSTGGRKPKGATEGRYEHNFTEHERLSQSPGYNDVRPPYNNESHQRIREVTQNAQFQPGLFSRDEAQGKGKPMSALQRRLGAHADANQQALADHIAATRRGQ
jgi:hypothetical protein